MKYYNFLTDTEVKVNTKQYDFNLEMAEKLSTRSTVSVRGIPRIFSSGEESNKIIHKN